MQSVAHPGTLSPFISSHTSVLCYNVSVRVFHTTKRLYLMAKREFTEACVRVNDSLPEREVTKEDFVCRDDVERNRGKL